MTVRRKDVEVKVVTLRHVRLYRDELESITKILREFGDVNIDFDAFEATEPSDFENLPESVKEVAISAACDKAEVKVILNRKTARIVTTEPNILTQGVTSHIRIICQKGRRLSPKDWLILISIAILCTISATATQALAPPYSTLGAIVPLSLFMIFIQRTLLRISGESACIINAYRAERPTFLQRTRDDWIVESIVLVIGLVAGYVLGRLTGS